ncbi:MAG: hypothetical protein LBG21_02035 [Campylobacteraceae bacterium]|nr:hypothetical protein [Campylobacteraceae bacterium]
MTDWERGNNKMEEYRSDNEYVCKILPCDFMFTKYFVLVDCHAASGSQ